MYLRCCVHTLEVNLKLLLFFQTNWHGMADIFVLIHSNYNILNDLNIFRYKIKIKINFFNCFRIIFSFFFIEAKMLVRDWA